MYEFKDTDERNSIVWTNAKGDEHLLANFTATIIEETKFVDGAMDSTSLKIAGKHKGKKLPTVDIPADKFPSLAWVLPSWGVGPVISPIPNAERLLRAAIQQNSNPKKQTIYMHTGWVVIDGFDTYLSNSGGINKHGHQPKVAVKLPQELSSFAIKPDPENAIQAIRNTLAMSQLGPPEMMWPIIAATVRPPIGPADYAIHISGQTGTFKSEVSALVQSHYGAKMDARHLPGSWSSTANALEAQSFRCKNAIFCIDDFVPSGSSWQVKALQKTADQIIRAQGNQAGRARLTDMSSHQTTMYPRGLILSTGEDIPISHSIRGRMMIIDITPGEIDKKRLTACQKQRPTYVAGMAKWIQWLAAHGVQNVQDALIKRREEIRDANADVGHTRTPTTLGDLQATIILYLSFAEQVEAITKDEHARLIKRALAGIMDCCKEQERHLKNADPTETFLETIRAIMGGCLAHMRSTDGGIPKNPESLGWTSKEGIDGLKTYIAHGPKMGWVNWELDEFYLDAATAYSLVVRHSKGAISQTKQTMLKRLKDQGILIRTDETRQRNTVRVTCENQSKHVFAMRLTNILENQEVT